jgi:hypothetical protein
MVAEQMPIQQCQGALPQQFILLIQAIECVALLIPAMLVPLLDVDLIGTECLVIISDNASDRTTTCSCSSHSEMRLAC